MMMMLYADWITFLKCTFIHSQIKTKTDMHGNTNLNILKGQFTQKVKVGYSTQWKPMVTNLQNTLVLFFFYFSYFFLNPASFFRPVICDNCCMTTLVIGDISKHMSALSTKPSD